MIATLRTLCAMYIYVKGHPLSSYSGLTCGDYTRMERHHGDWNVFFIQASLELVYE